MKGYTYHGKDYSPCFFCRHRDKLTVEPSCYSCLDNEDLALHKPSHKCDFASFEPLSANHLAVLLYEQES